ncbi:hypothetical protein MAR_002161 [Mya arenaria]|uniref:Uncharacterized protein n=1 Tax=Mya arenaria TaxID=6604 RepID=A0ABY7FDR7_MYAAR|nr:hypothetical protein MAR_002161 [Mya arenaria]
MSRSNQSHGVSGALNHNRSDGYQYPTQRASDGPYQPYGRPPPNYSSRGQRSRVEPTRSSSYSMGTGRGSSQLQEQLQPSKQMLSTVYGNTISMLEEFESRESQGRYRLPTSHIPTPDQTWKTKEDSVLETQLMCLETQRKSCPNDARNELLDDLKRKTIHWASVREENNCPRQQTDKYAAQIYEILDKGKTDHAFQHRPRPVITERTIRETMPHIMKGKHDQMELDRQFRDDRHRMSTTPAVRRATGRNVVKLGSSRIGRENPHLQSSLDAQDDEYFDNK